MNLSKLLPDFRAMICAHCPEAFDFATAQVLAVQVNAPPLATGAEKHALVAASVRARFGALFVGLLDFALDIVVKAAFAQARAFIPALFAPALDAAEKVVQDRIAQPVPPVLGGVLDSVLAAPPVKPLKPVAP